MPTTTPIRTRPPPTDPFYPVLVDCVFAAQGLIHAGNGGLMTMLPRATSYPAAPNPLDAAPEVVRAFGVICLCLGGLYIQSVYQSNRGFQKGSIILRLFTAWILWGNGAEWRLAGLVEGGLAFMSLGCLVLEGQGRGR